MWLSSAPPSHDRRECADRVYQRFPGRKRSPQGRQCHKLSSVLTIGTHGQPTAFTSTLRVDRFTTWPQPSHAPTPFRPVARCGTNVPVHWWCIRRLPARKPRALWATDGLLTSHGVDLPSSLHPLRTSPVSRSPVPPSFRSRNEIPLPRDVPELSASSADAPSRTAPGVPRRSPVPLYPLPSTTGRAGHTLVPAPRVAPFGPA